MKTLPSETMWRTLVRVQVRTLEGVFLIIPGVDVRNAVFCPKEAIPPAIFKRMKKDKRYHVGCNIGAGNVENLCFDGWEAE